MRCAPPRSRASASRRSRSRWRRGRAPRSRSKARRGGRALRATVRARARTRPRAPPRAHNESRRRRAAGSRRADVLRDADVEGPEQESHEQQLGCVAPASRRIAPQPIRGGRRRASTRLRAVRDGTIEEIDRLVGSATPHFAYQLRARIASWSRACRRQPTRRYGEQRMALLDRLGHASSRAKKASRSRAGGSAGTRSRAPRRPRVRCRREGRGAQAAVVCRSRPERRKSQRLRRASA